MTTNAARRVFRIKGTTDEVTECELCGRIDLKGTIVLATLDADGNEEDIVYYGASCGAKAAKWTTKEIRTEAKVADRKAREAKHAASEDESRIYCAARDTWIAQNYGNASELSHPRRHGFTSSYAMVVAFEQATGWRS
jgi:hypothetical protein